MASSNDEVNCEILVIGSGLAGLFFSLQVAKHSEFYITIITKRKLDEGSTKWAQGGVASALGSDDTIENHLNDTIVAGDGLCHKSVVKEIVQEGPSIVKELINLGVDFDRNEAGDLDLGKEGAHSSRRVAHAKDTTGRVIQQTLVNHIKSNPQIKYYEDHIAIDLVNVGGKIAGAYVFDKNSNKVRNFSSKITILATGGAGKVFLYTSNPDFISGDGIAMAYRVGASIANMEFVQFHPTLYYNPDFPSFLISEALRGEGAILRDIHGNEFMGGYHELKELAPRDVVARAIDNEMKKTGEDYVILDISHKDSAFVKERFPVIFQTLLKRGVDITKQGIPVVPAAHYTIGGIRVKTNGVTEVPQLLAIGEVAYTGLHGANRLASNSLLEAAVMAKKAAKYAINNLTSNSLIFSTFPTWVSGDAVDSDEAGLVSHNWGELRRAMWAFVGIVRTKKRLLRAKQRIELLTKEIHEYYWQYHVTSEIIELRNLVQVAELIVDSALFRKESRGAHYILDYPEKLDQKRDVLVQNRMGIYFSQAFE